MNLNFTAPINKLSYGKAGRNILKELLRKKVHVSLWPIGSIDAYPNEYDSIRAGMTNQQMYDCYAPSLRLWHQFDLAQHVGKGRRIGFPIFELDDFTVVEKHHLQSQDNIFVASHWAKEVVSQQAGIHEQNIHVVPLGVDVNIYHPSVEPLVDTTNKFVILNIGKIEVRKGHDVLHTVISKAFGSKYKDVELWMSWNNPFLSPEEVKEWENMYKNELGDRVKFIPWLNTDEEMARLIKSATLCFFPSRAEGFNLPLLECIAVGKRCIVTNWSAHHDFCGMYRVCQSIQITNTEPAVDGKWFGEGKSAGKWASLDDQAIEQMVYLLRKSYDGWLNNGRDKSWGLNEAGVETARRMTWSKTANEIMSELL